MNKPSLDELMNKMDSKYTLVVAAAKRARNITEGENTLVQVKSTKPVTLALKEIAQNKVTYERTKMGIK
ncbi:MAG: DNA-directed RNA polymerase subunit omega [Clostridia bacterium]|nr:DNA-directed RNA polymerase subunit omega [Clostridia bacterium]